MASAPLSALGNAGLRKTLMSSRKSKKSKRVYAQNPWELIIRKKAKDFLKAEKEYWKQRDALRNNMKEAIDTLSLKAAEALPADISSTVWGLRDGVAFVRHKSIPGQTTVQFRVLPITLEQWAETGLVVPLHQGDISLAMAGMRTLGHITFINCLINEIQIPYASFSHMRYGGDLNVSAVERAILDFQLTLLALQMQTTPLEGGVPGRLSGEATIERLQEIVRQFERLLEGVQDEGTLFQFLRQRPFVLHQSAESIPKQRLGEDFVTDFVLIDTTSQGPAYILVELERASHAIFTRNLELASPVIHAIKQTRDWDVWLENNKAYVQKKLPGFETPKYMIVIGRSNNFTEDHRAHMRSYNREWKNLELLTYDDVLARFKGTIQRLRATITK